MAGPGQGTTVASAELLEALRASGAAGREPVRFRFIEALARRAEGQTGEARRVIDEKLVRAAIAVGERCAGALKTLPDEEVDSILAEEGEIDMHCDYCGSHYLFNAMDIAEIRSNASPADPQVH